MFFLKVKDVKVFLWCENKFYHYLFPLRKQHTAGSSVEAQFMTLHTDMLLFIQLLHVPLKEISILRVDGPTGLLAAQPSRCCLYAQTCALQNLPQANIFVRDNAWKTNSREF